MTRKTFSVADKIFDAIYYTREPETIEKYLKQLAPGEINTLRCTSQYLNCHRFHRSPEKHSPLTWTADLLAESQKKSYGEIDPGIGETIASCDESFPLGKFTSYGYVYYLTEERTQSTLPALEKMAGILLTYGADPLAKNDYNVCAADYSLNFGIADWNKNGKCERVSLYKDFFKNADPAKFTRYEQEIVYPKLQQCYTDQEFTLS